MRRRKRQDAPDDPPGDDRAWCEGTNITARDAAGKDLVRYTPLPAETGPMWAPDRLSIWPVEGGRYGIDAHYHGHSGAERAYGQQERLKKVGLSATAKRDAEGGLIRIGPIAHGATWLALEAFLGKPL